jgi:hypothetical protein
MAFDGSLRDPLFPERAFLNEGNKVRNVLGGIGIVVFCSCGGSSDKGVASLLISLIN